MSKKKSVIHKSTPKPIASAEVKTIPINGQYWLWALLLLVITFVVLRPVLYLQFVNWDDPYNLLQNENLKIFSFSWDWDAVKKILTSGVIGNYNPLPIFTFALEKYFYAPDPVKTPFVFHFDNLWMHMMCTFLVYLFFVQLEVSKPSAFIGALLFGIHPMRVESVAWITERKDVLYGMFFMAALVCYLSYLKSAQHKVKWYLLILFFSLLSYFSKVQAVTLPLTMVAIDFYRRRAWYAPKILILEKLPWWLLSLAFGLLNIHFLGAQKSLSIDTAKVNYNFIDRLAVGAYSYATYILKWIYPYKLSPCYPYPPQLPVVAYVALVVVPILVIAFLVWTIRKQKTNLLFGFIFFTFNVMFLLQIVGAGQGFLADRFTYIAYIGLFFIFIKGIEQLMVQRPRYKPFLIGFIATYLSILGYLSYQQTKVWQNGGTLWEKVKAYFPNSPLAWQQAGNYYLDEQQDYARAIENYKQVIAMDPKDLYTHNSLAKCYMDQCFKLDPASIDFKKQQNYLVQLALVSYNESIRRDSIAGMPDKKQSGETIVNRGVAYAVLGDMDRCLADLSKGLSINPNNTNGYKNRGFIYFNQGKWALSLEDQNRFIALDPYNSDAFHLRAMCKLNLGNALSAMEDFNQAIYLKSDQPIYYIWRGKANAKVGNMQAAEKDIAQAKQLGMQVPADFLRTP